MKFVMIAFAASLVLALVALAAPSSAPKTQTEVRGDTVVRVVARSR
jgi:hypothetical protein